MFSHTYTGAQCCKHTAWMKCQADTEQKLLLAVLKIHTTGSECGWTNDRYIILNKIPFLPQKHVFHGCLEKGQIAGYEYWLYKLREIGLLENRRLTQWLNDRKETAKEKMCKTKKKKQGTICKIINHSVPYRTTQSFISGSSDTFHLPETVPSAGLSRLQHLQDQQSLYICHQHLLHLKAKIPSHGLISP